MAKNRDLPNLVAKAKQQGIVLSTRASCGGGWVNFARQLGYTGPDGKGAAKRFIIQALNKGQTQHPTAKPAPRAKATVNERPPRYYGDVASDAFLASYEWRRVRMMALKTYGPRCMCCGATPADGAVMNVDHIKPRLKFPKLALTLSNLQILCGPCNHGKGNWDMTDWRPTAESIDPDVVSLIRDIARNG
jgi:hypothetical protein